MRHLGFAVSACVEDGKRYFLGFVLVQLLVQPLCAEYRGIASALHV